MPKACRWRSEGWESCISWGNKHEERLVEAEKGKEHDRDCRVWIVQRDRHLALDPKTLPSYCNSARIAWELTFGWILEILLLSEASTAHSVIGAAF